MKVLVDTSVWSAALRRSRDRETDPVRELRNLITDNRVRMIGPIRQEILSGIREETQFKKLEARLSAFPDLPLNQEDHVTAARFFNLCRRKGVQGSNTDFLICAVAVHHRLAIFTTDRDFSLYAKHLPIVLHR
jgi:predicted nucleic acid-binding protein